MASEEERKAAILRRNRERLERIRKTADARKIFLSAPDDVSLEQCISQQEEKNKNNEISNKKNTIRKPSFNYSTWLLSALMWIIISSFIYRKLSSSINFDTRLSIHYWFVFAVLFFLVHIYKYMDYKNKLV